ncbi:MAG: hypothetical protein AAGD13_19920 [Pseudomonadota bacterium]
MSWESAVSWGFVVAGFLLLGAFVWHYLIMLRLSEIDARQWGEMSEEEEKELASVGPRLTWLNWIATILLIAAVLWFARGPLGLV